MQQSYINKIELTQLVRDESADKLFSLSIAYSLQTRSRAARGEATNGQNPDKVKTRNRDLSYRVPVQIIIYGLRLLFHYYFVGHSRLV